MKFEPFMLTWYAPIEWASASQVVSRGMLYPSFMWMCSFGDEKDSDVCQIPETEASRPTGHRRLSDGLGQK